MIVIYDKGISHCQVCHFCIVLFAIYQKLYYVIIQVNVVCGNRCICYSRNSLPNCCDCRVKCFPAAARVSIENGKSIRMSELQVGDRVQSGRQIQVDFIAGSLESAYSLIWGSHEIWGKGAVAAAVFQLQQESPLKPEK